jgi:hypothetical protein
MTAEAVIASLASHCCHCEPASQGEAIKTVSGLPRFWVPLMSGIPKSGTSLRSQ